MPTFADLEIRIRAAQEAGYPVEMRLYGQHFDGFVEHAIVAVNNGAHLLPLLLRDPRLQQGWEQARAQAGGRRRIRLWLDEPDLQNLPWEQLREDTWIAADAATPFSRYLPLSLDWGQAVTERPLRVLVAISNPHDLARYNLAPLDVVREKQMLEQALEKLAKGQVVLSFLDPPVTLERLEAAVREGHHILHYLGHGIFSQRRQQAALYLQDADGNTQIVHDEQLGEMLARQGARPRLVFLAACQSATAGIQEAFSGLAQKLIQTGVPAVVAMQDRVSIETTRVFSRTFYERLAAHGTVDLALNEARSTLVTGGRLDAAAPVLFMRLEDGQILGAITATEAVSFNVPFSQNPAFIGRDADLADLHECMMNNTSPVGLVGMGGVGKTQLAVEYAYTYRKHYPDGVFWLALPDRAATESAKEFSKRVADVAHVLPDLQKQLTDAPAALLIVDNLPDPNWLNYPLMDGIRALRACCSHILFTSRHLPRTEDFVIHELKPLSQPAALELLLRGAGRAEAIEVQHFDHQAAERLCAALGDLPLALLLAAAYLRQYPEMTWLSGISPGRAISRG